MQENVKCSRLIYNQCVKQEKSLKGEDPEEDNKTRLEIYMFAKHAAGDTAGDVAGDTAGGSADGLSKIKFYTLMRKFIRK